MLDALLMGDPEEPGGELGIAPEAADVPHGTLECLLDDIERLAFVPNELGDIHIERPFVLLEEVIPSMGILLPSGLDQG